MHTPQSKNHIEPRIPQEKFEFDKKIQNYAGLFLVFQARYDDRQRLHISLVIGLQTKKIMKFTYQFVNEHFNALNHHDILALCFADQGNIYQMAEDLLQKDYAMAYSEASTALNQREENEQKRLNEQKMTMLAKRRLKRPSFKKPGKLSFDPSENL